MGIGVSIFLVAVGAILRFAIDVTTEGVDIHMIGVILMVVGFVGALFSLMFWSTWGGWGQPPDEVMIERERRQPRRTVIIEKESRA